MIEPNQLHIDDRAPMFCLPDQDGKKVCLENFKGQWVVLYFYPKDNTPGCSLEAVDFTAAREVLEKQNTVILGVSPDSTKSHKNFIAKKELTITLLSDPKHTVLKKYGVWQLKKNYGKEYEGVVRSTFLISPDGDIALAWYNVRAKGHVEQVVQKVIELRQAH
jgi:peroxiredoxin Q/BCP